MIRSITVKVAQLEMNHLRMSRSFMPMVTVDTCHQCCRLSTNISDDSSSTKEMHKVQTLLESLAKEPRDSRNPVLKMKSMREYKEVEDCEDKHKIIKQGSVSPNQVPGFLNRKDTGRTWNTPQGVNVFLRQTYMLKPEFKKTVYIEELVLKDERIRGLELKKQVKAAATSEERIGLLSTYSTTDIRHLLISLTSVLNIHEYQDVLSSIERQVANNIDAMSTDELLYTMDMFYLLEQRPSTLYMAVFTLLLSQWHRLALTKDNVLQFLFYFYTYRNVPVALLGQIEELLEEGKLKLSGKEYALLCNAFFSNNRSIRSFTVMDSIAKALLKDLDDMKCSLICNVLKSMRHSRYNNTEFYMELGDRLCHHKHLLTSLSSVDVSHIAVTYAALKIYHPKLFVTLQKIWIKQISRSDGMVRGKDLFRMIGAFTAFSMPVNYLIPTDWIDKTHIDKLRFAELFLEGLISLGMNNIFQGEWIDYMLHPETVKIKTSRLLEQNYQLLLLDTMVGVMCPSYKGHRLSEDKVNTLRQNKDTHIEMEMYGRTGLAPLVTGLRELLGGESYVRCHCLLNHSTIPDIEIRFASDNSPLPLDVEKTPNVVPRVLSDREYQLNKGERGTQRSVIETLMTENSPHKLDREIPKNDHVTPTVSKFAEKRVTVKVYSWNQYASNALLLLRMHAVEHQLLAAMGYHVITVNPVDASKLGNSSKSSIMEYIQTNILSKIN